MAKKEHPQFLQEGIQVINYKWQYVFLNDIALLQSGRKSKENLVGNKITTVFPDIFSTPLFDILQKCMGSRNPCRLENLFVNRDNSTKWFDLRIQPCDEGICIFSVDISLRKENENKLKKANGLYALLTNISHKIVTVKDEKELFRDCCTLALRFGDFNMAWIGLFDADLKTLTMVDQSGIPEKELPLFYEALKSPNEQLAYIVQSGKYYVSKDIQNESGLEQWQHYAIKDSIKSFSK